MNKCNVQLLGPVLIEWETAEPPRFRSQRTMALLGYLATEKRPIAREALVTLLWPDETSSKGKANLRRELHNLSQILPGCWQTDRQTVTFVPSAETWLDIYELQSLTEAEKWSAAAELMQGEFLAGIYLEGNLEFETWLMGERERWRQRAEHILSQAVLTQVNAGDEVRALRYARQLLQLLPWHEEMHRQVMMLLAQRGQRSAALQQYEQCKELLREELGIAVSAETQALYERIRDNASFTLHNIPAPTTPLIGRDDELTFIKGLLADSDIRLVTITGAGGMGKTRLALALAQDILDRSARPFSDGIYFVSLASLSKPTHLISEIATVLHFPLQSQDKRSPRQQLLDYLQRQQMLLILDNFEHLLPGAELLTDVVKAAPGVQVLATSRERLHLQGEQVVRLQGLGYDEPGEKELERSTPAARLFLSAAKRVRHGFRQGDVDGVHLTRICRLVEGMPLALELAATWTDTLSLAAIGDGIEASIDFLEANRQDVPQRHRSMLAVFDSSWQLLEPEAQRVFAGLSVFRGEVNRQAAEAVVGATVRSLSCLVSHSLLVYDATTDRYHLHELLRQYAAIRLSAAPDYHERVNQKHSDYFCHWLHSIGPEIQSVRQPLHETGFVAYVPNTERAVGWALKYEQIDNLIAAVNNLGKLYMRLHRYCDGLDLFREIANLAESGVQRQPEDARWRYLLAIALIWLSDFIELFGEDAPCQEWLGRSIELLETPEVAALADGAELAAAYLVLGDTYQDAEAVDCYLQSLSAARAANNRWAEANALQRLGMALRWTDRDEAYAAAYASYQLWQELGDMRGTSWAADVLAAWALSVGEYLTAEQYAQEALALSRSLRATDHTARSAFTLGWVALAQGDFQKAVSYHEMSLLAWESLGFYHGDIDTRFALGFAHVHAGRLERAQEVADVCRAHAEDQQREEGVLYSRLLSGMVSLAREQPLQALKDLQAITNTPTNERFGIQTLLYAVLARLAIDPVAATETLADVEARVDQVSSYPLMTARLKVVQAAVWGAHGQVSTAHQLWSEACREPLVAHSHWYAMVLNSMAPALAILT